MRTVCSDCAEKTNGDLNEEEKVLAERNKVEPTMRAVGCKTCGDSGYRGRGPVNEVVSITPDIQSLIAKGAPHLELRRAAKAAGFRAVRESALDHVKSGATTLQELERVLGKPSDKDDLGDEQKNSRFRRLDEKNEGETEAPTEASEEAAPPAKKTRAKAKRTKKTTRKTSRRKKTTRSKKASSSASEEEAPPPPSAEEPSSDAGEVRHVLLVEDDPVTRKQAKRLLMKEGYEVTEAVDGEHALKRLDAKKDFALIVTDLNMPRMDGRGVIAKVRGDSATASLPIIVLTASTDPEMEIELMDEGADDYIRKPIDPPYFHARIRGVLRRAGIA